ncbi:MAG TPA: DUF6438 domain-containing protein [Steroidobacteraceae bacterium]|nr:DUF6438 domain-containing protein [Steroidobacteraceae bacterium]
MRALDFIAAIAAIFVATVSAPQASNAAEYPYGRTATSLSGAPLDDSTVITLQRGPCFGDCPEYTVTVYGSGRVEFVGTRFVCAPGHRRAQASPDEVRSLVERMLAFGYLDLYWRAGATSAISPNVISSLSHGGRTHRIEHRLEDAKAPPLLKQFEKDIDAVAGSWRWLPEREDDRRVCRLSDGETKELLDLYIPTR